MGCSAKSSFLGAGETAQRLRADTVPPETLLKIYAKWRQLTCSAKNEKIVNIISVASTQWVQNFSLSRYALLFRDQELLSFTKTYCAYR